MPIRNFLTLWDWLVFFGILFLTFLAVLYGHHLKKKQGFQNTALEYLLMGRKLTLPLFVATLVSTWYGGIFGVTQIAFEKGIYNFLTQGVFWYLVYIFFAFFLVPKIRNIHALTLPELVHHNLGPWSGHLSAVFNFLNVIPIAYAISVGLFLQALFPMPFLGAVSLGILIVTTYTLFGGFRADVFSDCVQFFVMCSSVLIVVIFSIFLYGGYDFLQSHLPPSHFSPLGGEPLSVALVWGFVALSTLIDPSFYQRCFAAQSEKVARHGILISILIWFCFDICTTLGGMYARAVLPEAPSSQAYLLYGMQLFPEGLRGFFLAGILATILSTLDSFLFIGGQTLFYDLMPKRLRTQRWIHYGGIMIVALLSIGLALVFEGNIPRAWKTIGGYMAACFLFPVMLSYFFPKKIKDKQCVFACLLGVLGTSTWKNVTLAGFWAEVDAFYIGALSTLFGLILYELFYRVRSVIQRK